MNNKNLSNTKILNGDLELCLLLKQSTMYVCMYVLLCNYVYILLSMYVCMYVGVYVCMNVCMHVWVCMPFLTDAVEVFLSFISAHTFLPRDLYKR